MLFQGSTSLTEGITSKKYPEYKTYQQKVGKFLPNFSGKGWDEAAEAESKQEKSK
jgi:steroid 5-alpha reductase family enzyme